MIIDVLLVDDEQHILAALGRLLRHAGISFVKATSGDEALKLLEQYQPLVVLSDYKMPGMTGTELLAKVEAKVPQTVRIILSGNSDFDTVLQAVHSGVVHKFLAKPWSNEELLEHIQAACQERVQFISDTEESTQSSQSVGPVECSSRHTPINDTEKQLKVLLNTVVDGMVTISQYGIIQAVNRALLTTFGYTENELIGKNVSMLMPEPYRSQHDLYLSRYNEKKVNGVVGNLRRLVGLKKNGEVFPIELSVNFMQLDSDTQFLGMIRDISRRVEAERENQLLIEALESSQDGFALFGAGDKLIRCNHQFKKMYQACRIGPVEGVTYQDFFLDCIDSGLFPAANEDKDQWITQLLDAHNNLPLVTEYEIEPGKWIEIRETRSEGGAVIVSHLDISDWKKTLFSLKSAVTEAEHANSARGKFLAMMSHEIRTPLNGVIGLLQLMRDTELSAQQTQYIDTAFNSGQSLLTIISDILDFSKMEAAKLEIQPAPCELLGLLEDLEQLFHLRIEEKSIQLSLHLVPSLPRWINVDGQRLRQVLLNLLSNSIKFTDYGEVRLTLSPTSDGKIRFLVMDTGIGIPEIEQQKIFSEFTTINHESANRLYEGTGLGLAISYNLVHLLGGELEFKSTPNLGSQFWFELPLIEAPEPVQSESRTTATDRFIGHVLLVDDSATNRLVAKAMLEAAGLTITSAESGYKAIEACINDEFDLILMDISMPGIDGLETTERIKRLPNWKNTPVIAVTAYAMPEDEQRFLDHGMTDYVEKPLDKQRLLQVVGRYLQKSTVTPKEKMVSDNSVDENKPLTDLLNPEQIEQLVKDTSEDILPELTQIFVRDTNERLHELEQNTLDAQSVERQLHTLGSSAALYGLMSFHEQARELERQCMQKQDVVSKLPMFITLGKESLKALAQYLQER